MELASEWLVDLTDITNIKLSDLGRLDSSFCNHEYRLLLLDYFDASWFSLKCSTNVNLGNRQTTKQIDKNISKIKWMTSKKIKTNFLFITLRGNRSFDKETYLNACSTSVSQILIRCELGYNLNRATWYIEGVGRHGCFATSSYGEYGKEQEYWCEKYKTPDGYISEYDLDLIFSKCGVIKQLMIHNVETISSTFCEKYLQNLDMFTFSGSYQPIVGTLDRKMFFQHVRTEETKLLSSPTEWSFSSCVQKTEEELKYYEDPYLDSWFCLDDKKSIYLPPHWQNTESEEENEDEEMDEAESVRTGPVNSNSNDFYANKTLIESVRKNVLTVCPKLIMVNYDVYHKKVN
jgi:hypothetical protein